MDAAVDNLDIHSAGRRSTPAPWLGAADHVPFPAPPGGWQRQAVDGYAAMGAVDLVISVRLP